MSKKVKIKQIKSVEKMIKGSCDDTASYAKSDSRVAD